MKRVRAELWYAGAWLWIGLGILCKHLTLNVDSIMCFDTATRWASHSAHLLTHSTGNPP